MFPRIDSLRSDRKSASRLGQALRGLSRIRQGSVRVDPEIAGVVTLRTYFIYETTRDPDILCQLVASNLSVFPDEYYRIMVNTVLEGIFETYEAEDIPVLLRRMFRMSRKKWQLLSQMLAVRVPRDGEDILQETFFQLLDSLPRDEETERLRAMALQRFRPKRRFWK
jgi:hypothetical protein